MAVIFDDLSDELCRVADMAEFVRQAHPDQTVATAAQEACISVSLLVEQLNTHTGIFSRLKEAVERGDVDTESEVDNHVAKLFLQDFIQCGIDLPEADRNTVVELNDSILRIGKVTLASYHMFTAPTLCFCRSAVFLRLPSAPSHPGGDAAGRCAAPVQCGEGRHHHHVRAVL